MVVPSSSDLTLAVIRLVPVRVDLWDLTVNTVPRVVDVYLWRAGGASESMPCTKRITYCRHSVPGSTELIAVMSLVYWLLIIRCMFPRLCLTTEWINCL